MLKFLSRNKNKNSTETPEPTDRTPEQKEAGQRKKATVFLAIFSVLVLVFSGWYINRQLNSPFVIKSENTNTNELASALNLNSGQAIRLDSLRQKDTDQDGISDYDELYNFKTSPYISDTDSDGVNDKIEIDQGGDPNCPQGVNCYRQTSNTNSAVNSLTNSTGETSTQFDPNDVTPDQLRAILKGAGASEESLKQLDDAKLMETYQALLAEEGGNLNFSAAVNSGADANAGNTSVLDIQNPDTITYEKLISLTPSEIRKFLIESGVPKESLDQIDDDTLRQIYQDSLAENLQTASE